MSGQSRWLLTFSTKRVEQIVQRADSFGVRRNSSRFKYMVTTASSINEVLASARMNFLSSTLNCSMDKIHGIVRKMPAILGLSEEKLRIKLEFLSTILNCPMDKICDIVCKTPTVLGLSEDKFRSKIDLLSSILGCRMDKLCSAVYMCSKILALSETKLRSKIEYLVTKF
uniref:Uncharacterized protein n=1 Tax=Leersia perrieri TaxID=77586 RepID=A0A0D9XIF3_9ORYZ